MKVHYRFISAGLIFSSAIIGCLTEKGEDNKSIFINFHAPRVVWDSAQKADSTIIAADILDHLSGSAQLTWALGRSDSIVATRDYSEDSLTDSLRF